VIDGKCGPIPENADNEKQTEKGATVSRKRKQLAPTDVPGLAMAATAGLADRCIDNWKNYQDLFSNKDTSAP